MSTRATYEIDGTTFYCHWDGYPAGAAYRFAKMVEALTVPELGDRRTIQTIEDRRGGAAFAFIRGVMDAEPTESHAAHGDTEHRYRVKTAKGSGELTIEHAARNWSVEHHPAFNAWSSPEPLADWINREALAWEGELAPIVVAMRDPSPHWKRTILATLENAKAIAAAELELEKQYQESNPNRGRHAAQAQAWSDAIAELDIAGMISRLTNRKAALELEAEKAKEPSVQRLHKARADRVARVIASLATELELEPAPRAVPGQRPGETAIDAENRRAREIMTPPGTRLL